MKAFPAYNNSKMAIFLQLIEMMHQTITQNGGKMECAVHIDLLLLLPQKFNLNIFKEIKHCQWKIVQLMYLDMVKIEWMD
eukprot:15367192-Ditylum_brightwellii.AAC.1